MPTPIHLTSFIEGVYTDVPIINIPQNALYIQDNCVTSHKLGAILKRPGYLNIGSALQANKGITGLHNFRQSSSVQKMLATVDDATSDDTQLFYSTGGAWAEIAGAETAWANKAGINVEMEDFIGYCFFVGYGATDGFLPNGTLTGTTFGTTNTTDMPTAKYIKRYRDKLYIANCYNAAAQPYRVYYSSVPSAGTISWTVASDFFDVDYSEEITGLGQNWDNLIVFTQYSAYMYNQDSKGKVWDIGCSNHRNIKNYGQYMVWADMNNVWISSGGFPQAIGGRVIDFIRSANMANSFAEIVDEEYHLYLGNITVNGISYSNLTLIFNFPTQTWRWYEYYDTMTVFARYYKTGENYLWMGASDGDVHELAKYTDATLINTDDGQPIHSWFQTGTMSFGDPSSFKRLGRIITYADRAQGLQLRARVIDRGNLALTEFKPLIQITKFINEKQINPDKGYFLQIEGSENGSNPYWSFLGMTIMTDLDKPAKN